MRHVNVPEEYLKSVERHRRNEYKSDIVWFLIALCYKNQFPATETAAMADIWCAYDAPRVMERHEKMSLLTQRYSLLKKGKNNDTADR